MKSSTKVFTILLGVVIVADVHSANAMVDLEIGLVGYPKIIQKMYKYHCEGNWLDADDGVPEDVFKVNYMQADGNNLAVLPIKNQNRIFSLTTATSGKKYVSGHFIWWQRTDNTVLLQKKTESGVQSAICHLVGKNSDKND